MITTFHATQLLCVSRQTILQRGRAIQVVREVRIHHVRMAAKHRLVYLDHRLPGAVPRPEMIRGHDPRSRLGDRMFGNILGTLRGQTPEGIETTP